jgi:hypothetical protein
MAFHEYSRERNLRKAVFGREGIKRSSSKRAWIMSGSSHLVLNVEPFVALIWGNLHDHRFGCGVALMQVNDVPRGTTCFTVAGRQMFDWALATTDR